MSVVSGEAGAGHVFATQPRRPGGPVLRTLYNASLQAVVSGEGFVQIEKGKIEKRNQTGGKVHEGDKDQRKEKGRSRRVMGIAFGQQSLSVLAHWLSSINHSPGQGGKKALC